MLLLESSKELYSYQANFNEFLIECDFTIWNYVIVEESVHVKTVHTWPLFRIVWSGMRLGLYMNLLISPFFRCSLVMIRGRC